MWLDRNKRGYIFMLEWILYLIFVLLTEWKSFFQTIVISVQSSLASIVYKWHLCSLFAKCRFWSLFLTLEYSIRLFCTQLVDATYLQSCFENSWTIICATMVCTSQVNASLLFNITISTIDSDENDLIHHRMCPYEGFGAGDIGKWIFATSCTVQHLSGV